MKAMRGWLGLLVVAWASSCASLPGGKAPLRVGLAPNYPPLIQLAEGRASGHSGCNQMMGGYTSDGVSTLNFGQMAGTMMMCQPQDMDLERLLLTTLGEVNGYRYADQELLLLKDGVPVARYEALTVK